RTVLAAVPARVALSGISYGLPVVDTRGNVDRDFARFLADARSAASLAGVGYDFAFAFAHGANARGRKLTERCVLGVRDLPRAAAVGADFCAAAGFCTGAVAIRTGLRT